MPITFNKSADKHGVPRKSSWRVAMTAVPTPITTNQGKPGMLFIGKDDRGIELEVITVQKGPNEEVIHSMPTSHRFKG